MGDNILAKSMFVHITEEGSDSRPTIRMGIRPISFFGDPDSEIADWLGGRPSVSIRSDLGMCGFPNYPPIGFLPADGPGLT